MIISTLIMSGLSVMNLIPIFRNDSILTKIFFFNCENPISHLFQDLNIILILVNWL